MLDLKSLNPPQREAVETTEGPVLVLAGAGSGKTRVITFRIAHLIDSGVLPERILALSFTNKAAGEMKERVAQMMGHAAKGVVTSTFHSLGMRFLREEGQNAGLNPGFTIMDEGDQIDAVRRSLKLLGYDEAKFNPKNVFGMVSHYKGRLELPDGRRGGMEAVVQHVLPLYQQRLRAMNAVDFDDLIALPVKLLESNAAIAQKWASRFRYIMVDEYQDTNGAQLRFIKALAKGFNNICAVGDDDQSIYAWRGAVAGNILRFSEHFPGARIIFLTQNYRSTNNVLKAANCIIAHNTARHEKNLWSENGDGPLLRLKKVSEGSTEGDFIASDLQGLRRAYNLQWRDIAVLYRTNAQSRQLEESIRQAGIPYRIVGGTKFYDRKEVRDVLSYLRVMVNPDDEAAYRRIINYPIRGIGDATIERISQFATQNKIKFTEAATHPDRIADLPPQTVKKLSALSELINKYRDRFNSESMADVCRDMITEVGFADELSRTYKDLKQVERRWDNVQEIASALKHLEDKELGLTLSDYVSKVCLDSRPEEDSDSNADEVSLMTIHGSKGLEFEAVYIAGMEEGFMPHKRVLEGEGDVDEERRLAYVAVTRAKRYLTLTLAEKRLHFGKIEHRRKSRFLDEINESLFSGNKSGKNAEAEAERDKRNISGFAAMRSLFQSKKAESENNPQ